VSQNKRSPTEAVLPAEGLILAGVLDDAGMDAGLLTRVHAIRPTRWTNDAEAWAVVGRLPSFSGVVLHSRYHFSSEARLNSRLGLTPAAPSPQRGGNR